jgi:hypothetical protein
MSKKILIYLELGKKRAFAGALDWPGWCRSGKDEAAALQALVDYAPRYAAAIKSSGLEFDPPSAISDLKVIEHLAGDSTTDFGAPSIAPSADSQPLKRASLERRETLLQACWEALDKAVRQAGKRQLRKGPRGGGRATGQILKHIIGAELGYLSALGWKYRGSEDDISPAALKALRAAILEGLRASARGEIPARGPRGGLRWSPRYFVRRLAWHSLDHAWEIEDRL